MFLAVDEQVEVVVHARTHPAEGGAGGGVVEVTPKQVALMIAQIIRLGELCEELLAEKVVELEQVIVQFSTVAGVEHADGELLVDLHGLENGDKGHKRLGDGALQVLRYVDVV